MQCCCRRAWLNSKNSWRIQTVLAEQALHSYRGQMQDVETKEAKAAQAGKTVQQPEDNLLKDKLPALRRAAGVGAAVTCMQSLVAVEQKVTGGRRARAGR